MRNIENKNEITVSEEKKSKHWSIKSMKWISSKFIDIHHIL